MGVTLFPEQAPVRDQLRGTHFLNSSDRPHRGIVVEMNRFFSSLLQLLSGCMRALGLVVPFDRTAEELAVPSEDYPLAGFWKVNPESQFGIAIAPAGDGYYSISFCGPRGCFRPGQWRPNTRIIDDNSFRVVNSDCIDIYQRDEYVRHRRFKSRTSYT